jgi:hypothetical protein
MREVSPEAISIVLAALGLFTLAVALRRLFRVRLFAATKSTLAALLLIASAAALLVVSSNLRSYARLTHEEPIGELAFVGQGPQQFRATLTRVPTGDEQTFILDGDEWQLDARVLKWRGFANLLGLDARYRLERISGRYSDIDQERAGPRTVYALAADSPIDLWAIARAHPSWLPFVDALYGSATYLPMADGARYRVTISQTGLLARPSNDAAEQANRAWK